MIHWFEKKTRAYIHGATTEELVEALKWYSGKKVVFMEEIGQSSDCLKLKVIDDTVYISGCYLEEIEDRLRTVLEE